MGKPVVSINIVVLNGEKYIQGCLDSVLAQSYSTEFIEINILDNGSADATKNIIRNFGFRISNLGFSKFNFIESKLNFGMWGGQEELLKNSSGKYVVFLSVDVILEKDFIKNAVQAMEANSNLGAIQAKVFQFSLNPSGHVLSTIIDSCGFKIFRSRRVINIGHGETDNGQFNKSVDIFGVEGAVPILRTEALQSIRVLGEIADHDLFWYGEDLDVAWRLRMAGWEQYYEPSVVAWHDRQTTKRTRRGIFDFIAIRRMIPLRKRQLEWRNIRCTVIKNDYIINLLKDMPYILPREITMFVYLLFFETAVLIELPKLLSFIPRMLRKRKEIMKHSKTNPAKIHSYFN